MKKFFIVTLFAALSMPVSLFPVHAGTPWKYIGLRGATVNAMVPMIGFSPDGIMVGMQSGIRNYEYGHWDTTAAYATWNGLPVYDIIRITGERLLAAAGNGSDSDGVYIGTVSAIGEPGTRWRFSLLAKCPRPTALAFSPMEGGCAGRLFIGNAEGVRAGLLCRDTLKELTPITGPANPFGGFCESMLVGSEDGKLYAGGYDRNPREGLDSAWLLRGDASGLSALRPMNVTSIVEMPPQAMAGSVRDIKLLAIATIDSGIYTVAGGSLFNRISVYPVRTEPVLSIAPFRGRGTMHWNELIAATKSGVYRQCPPDADCTWTKMDGLPGSPKRLAHYQDAVLWAATDSGIYQYGIPTAIDRNWASAQKPVAAVHAGRAGKNEILVSIGNIPGRASEISLFDMQGRCLTTCAIPRSQAVIGGLGKGLFLFSIAVDGKVVRAGRLMRY